MADKMILVDTSILIDYYRKTDKDNSIWIELVRSGYKFAVSSVTKYEIFSGATAAQLRFWDDVLKMIEVISFDEVCADTAVEINAGLKRKEIK
jgi:predicted nucleic acid-binding protein